MPATFAHGSGAIANYGSYEFKVIQYQLNSPLRAQSDGIPFNYLPMGSHHRGGGNFLMADGSVHYVSELVAFDIYRGLATCNRGESVHLDR